MCIHKPRYITLYAVRKSFTSSESATRDRGSMDLSMHGYVNGTFIPIYPPTPATLYLRYLLRIACPNRLNQYYSCSYTCILVRDIWSLIHGLYVGTSRLTFLLYNRVFLYIGISALLRYCATVRRLSNKYVYFCSYCGVRLAINKSSSFILFI